MALTANSAGVVTGKFTIPSGIPAGTKAVLFQGSGGSSGAATFVGQGTLNTQTQRRVTTVTTAYYDPLAQTFTLGQAAQIYGADLYFSAKGSSNVTVQIRETDNGVPTQTILAERRLKPDDIIINQYTRVSFSSPVALSAGIEYALVILCDDAVSALKVGELGKWDDAAKKWVTSQPYQVGVLLSSSNASTWTAHQDKDLAFRLCLATYTDSNKVVNLGTVAVSNATDLMLLTADEIPNSSSQIKYELILPDASVVVVSDGQPVRLATAISGNVTIRATLMGTADFSPILFPGTQLIVGRVGTTGSYVSQAIKGGSNVRVKVIFDALVPSGAAVNVSYKGADAGDTWSSVPFVSSSQGDEGWLSITHEVTGVTEDMVHVKLDLSGTSSARPRVRNLRFMTV